MLFARPHDESAGCMSFITAANSISDAHLPTEIPRDYQELECTYCPITSTLQDLLYLARIRKRVQNFFSVL